MKEIGIDVNEGLSAAFLEKNGEVERQELNSFTEMFSVRDLLGVGAFGVVLLVKNRVTKEKSALKIISKERLSSRAQKILKNESTIRVWCPSSAFLKTRNSSFLRWNLFLEGS